MPVFVRKKKKNETGKLWKIYEKGGKVVAEASTKKQAETSARIRNSKL